MTDISTINNGKTKDSNDDFDWDNNTWPIIDSFFKQDNILINHHITSFNYFMNTELQSIVKEKEFNPIKIYNKTTWNEDLQLYTETYQIEFGKIYISKPVLYDAPNKPMYPHEARLRKLTYGASLYIDIYHKTVTINPATGNSDIKHHDPLNKYPCGRMPIMVGSKYCVLSEQNNLTKMDMGEGVYDHGGYFIVKGSEKVIICQEKKCENKICCFKQKAAQSKYSEVAEISCIHPTNQSIVSPVWVKMKAKEESYGGNVIRIRLRRMKQDIPLIIIFRALNYIKDKAIVELIIYDTENENNNSMMELLKASIEEAKPINSQKLALEYISKYVTNIQTAKYKTNNCKLKYTYETLCSELFPHVGESPIKKAFFLGYMVNKLLKCNLGLTNYDDRDSFLNKRVETSGNLMAQLFRAYFGKFVKDLKTTCDKDMIANKFADLPVNLSKKLKPNSIENDIKYALGTGNWGLKNQAKSRKGIAAVLQRLTYLGTLSNLRRIVAPIDKNGKLTDPRKLHCTQWGVICPFETPEGGSIGIVKNMALTCQITIPCSDEPIKACLDEFGVLSLESIHPIDVFDTVKVFVNGDWYGQSLDPKGLIDNLRILRRNGTINPYISIAWYIQYNEIQIWTDGGRLCRPLYIIKNNKFVITDKIIDKIQKDKLMWKDILRNNDNDDALIEYVDVNEADTLMICMSKDNLLINKESNYSFYKYTHCEIHPSLMLGVLACNIPFPEHNQAPRNLYQGAMGKQAMGIYSTSFRNRMDTMAHILHYPQKPVVNTETSKYIYSDNLPSGQMPIVAIACYTGYNQEDSLIFNQSAIDRGLFKSSFYRTYMDEEKKNSATLEDEKFCKPQKFYPNGKIYTEKMSYGSYEKLDTNGIIKLNHYVDGNDIIIGKVTMLKDSIEGEPKARDLSTSIRSNESGIVDKIYKNSNGDGYNFVKVRVRSDRIPEIGDKLACILPDTDVLTTKGWKKMIDITKEDYIGVLDPKTDNIKYEKPSALHEYHHNGQMYQLRSENIDLTVTPNHRMWVKKRSNAEYEFIQAFDCLGKRLRYKKNVQNYQPEKWIGEKFTLSGFTKSDNKVIPEKVIDMNDWLTFVGIWLGEGWYDENSVGFSVYNNKVGKELEVILNRWGCEIFQVSCMDTGKYTKWSFENKQIANAMKYFMIDNGISQESDNLGFMEKISHLATDKNLPDWVWNLNKEQSCLLIDTMLLSSKLKLSLKTPVYYTESGKLANDLCRLCIHAGYSSHIKNVVDGVVDGADAEKTSYEVIITKKNMEPEINNGSDKSKATETEELIDYDASVYCVTVSTGIFMIRENGKSVWTGNSRHGQKGTIGLTYKQEDMPYTKDGIIPDLIVNPNAIPKRMTIAQLIECVFGKVGCISGSELDATPFRKINVENIREIMESLGYNGAGTEVLYNGKTGEMMTASIFIGPTFYYRLKHLVEDKLHSRATGPYQLLTMQPAEGRSRDGGFRFGEMERDCLTKNTIISLSYGLSSFIKNMDCKKSPKNGILEILGYSIDTKFMIPSKQTGFLYKGVRKCLELTLQDGKKMICTPNHKILTSNDEWIEAQNLIINETRVKASVENPVVDLDEEVKECNNWVLQAGDTILSTRTKDELLKTFAFMRILGYLITDGTIYKSKTYNSACSTIFIGHKLDVHSIKNDLRQFCKINENIKKSKNLYSVRIPANFTRDILSIEGIIHGKRVNQPACLPEFILDPDCPRPIVREFLAGMFGGDGHTSFLGMHRGKRDILSSIGFSQSKNVRHIDTLQRMMEDIKDLLGKCGLKKESITIQEAKRTTYSKENGMDTYEIPLHIGVDQLINFHDKIGFRHCCHKTQRLEAAVSHRRLKEEITRQKMWIIKRVGEITNFEEFKKQNPNKNLPTTKAIEKAFKELVEKEPLIHPYAKPNRGQVAYYFNRSQKSDEIKFTDPSLIAENFLAEIGALEWFLQESEQLRNQSMQKVNPSTETDNLSEKINTATSEIEETKETNPVDTLTSQIEDITIEESDDILEDENIEEILQKHAISYGIPKDATGLPTMNLKVIGIRDAGELPVYDIEVENTNSFLANGIVVHNCMLSHGSVQFLKERTFDSSDKYYVWIDDETGIISPVNPEKGIYKSLYSTNTTKFSKVQIPYSSKLLIQELMAMHIVPRIFTQKK